MRNTTRSLQKNMKNASFKQKKIKQYYEPVAKMPKQLNDFNLQNGVAKRMNEHDKS